MAPKSARILSTIPMLFRVLYHQQTGSELDTLNVFVMSYFRSQYLSHQNKEIWRQRTILSNTSRQGYLFRVKAIFMHVSGSIELINLIVVSLMERPFPPEVKLYLAQIWTLERP